MDTELTKETHLFQDQEEEILRKFQEHQAEIYNLKEQTLVKNLQVFETDVADLQHKEELQLNEPTVCKNKEVIPEKQAEIISHKEADVRGDNVKNKDVKAEQEMVRYPDTCVNVELPQEDQADPCIKEEKPITNLEVPEDVDVSQVKNEDKKECDISGSLENVKEPEGKTGICSEQNLVGDANGSEVIVVKKNKMLSLSEQIRAAKINTKKEKQELHNHQNEKKTEDPEVVGGVEESQEHNEETRNEIILEKRRDTDKTKMSLLVHTELATTHVVKEHKDFKDQNPEETVEMNQKQQMEKELSTNVEVIQEKQSDMYLLQQQKKTQHCDVIGPEPMSQKMTAEVSSDNDQESTEDTEVKENVLAQVEIVIHEMCNLENQQQMMVTEDVLMKQNQKDQVPSLHIQEVNRDAEVVKQEIQEVIQSLNEQKWRRNPEGNENTEIGRDMYEKCCVLSEIKHNKDTEVNNNTHLKHEKQEEIYFIRFQEPRHWKDMNEKKEIKQEQNTDFLSDKNKSGDHENIKTIQAEEDLCPLEVRKMRGDAKSCENTTVNKTLDNDADPPEDQQDTNTDMKENENVNCEPSGEIYPNSNKECESSENVEMIQEVQQAFSFLSMENAEEKR